MERIDLHIHTDYSDGTHTPAEVVQMAKAASLRAIAITDHDTMEGWEALGPVEGIEIIPGIERKSEWEGIEIHVLGYNVSWDTLKDHARIIDERNRRNAAVVELLRADGIPISMEELSRRKKGVIGRPHIAQLLVDKGYFPTVRKAFDEWLGEGQKYYVPLKRQSIPEVAAELKDAGGVVVLAHPQEYGLSDPDLRRLLALCRDCGFSGMEVWYSGYTDEYIRYLLGLCKEFGLLPSGGSDYHGERRPERIIGGVEATYDLWEALKAQGGMNR